MSTSRFVSYARLTDAEQAEIVKRASSMLAQWSHQDVGHAAVCVAVDMFGLSSANKRHERLLTDAYAACLTVLIHRGVASAEWCKAVPLRAVGR